MALSLSTQDSALRTFLLHGHCDRVACRTTHRNCHRLRPTWCTGAHHGVDLIQPGKERRETRELHRCTHAADLHRRRQRSVRRGNDSRITLSPTVAGELAVTGAFVRPCKIAPTPPLLKMPGAAVASCTEILLPTKPA